MTGNSYSSEAKLVAYKRTSHPGTEMKLFIELDVKTSYNQANSFPSSASHEANELVRLWMWVTIASKAV